MLFRLRPLLPIVTVLFALSACDKLPKNGDLDGSWQLMTLSETQEDGTSLTEEMKDSSVYWYFQLDLMEIYTPYVLHNGETQYTLGRFTQTKDSLTIDKLYFNTRTEDHEIADIGSVLTHTIGITKTPQTYIIATLNNDKMILQTDSSTLVFRKF